MSIRDSSGPRPPGAPPDRSEPQTAPGPVPTEGGISPQQRLQALIGNSPLAVIEWDSRHRVANWTGNAAPMFGWSAAEVLGKRLDEWRFVHEDDWETVRDAMQAMESGHNFVSRNRNYRKDGSLIHCEWHNSVLVDEIGNFAGALSLVLDTTGRKLAEEALRESEERHRQIVDQAPIGIFRSTVPGRFLSVNAKLAEMFGFDSPDEMTGAIRDIPEQIFADPSQRAAIVRHALESAGFVSHEVEYRHRAGHTFLCNLHVRALRDAAGRVVRLEGFVEDITQRRRAEESLRGAYDELERRVRERTAELSAANERLQELDRLKSQFLASMSHELRTPLNSIIGFTSLLRQGLTGPINAEQTKQLEIVQSSSKHLLALINDLLDVSRIEAGRATLDREPFDFVEVLAEVARSLEPMAGRKRLPVVCEVAAASIPMIGDRKRTLQVLLNLVNNAIKFTDQGSVTIRATAGQDTLRVAVEDTGIGIMAEHLAMLFEAFRQLDSSAKRIYEGTGLGLYLCRKLLGMMGGTIQVESEYGAGSRFSYTMPLRLPAESD